MWYMFSTAKTVMLINVGYGRMDYVCSYIYQQTPETNQIATLLYNVTHFSTKVCFNNQQKLRCILTHVCKVLLYGFSLHIYFGVM